jgi:putative flippase GtrA
VNSPPETRSAAYWRALSAQLFGFASVGAAGTAAHFVLLTILVEQVGVDAVWASTASFLLGAAINYGLNYRFTFRSNKPHRETAPNFFAIAFTGMGLNGVIMYIAINLLNWHYLPGQIVATGLVFFWNFFANRSWTFRG